jgi:hypothetical protein
MAEIDDLVKFYNGDEPSVPDYLINRFVREQIKYAKGKYEIECPHCRRQAVAYVSSESSHNPIRGTGRTVSVSCKYCSGFSFLWKSFRQF